RMQRTAPPSDMASLKEPTGGDQILARKVSNGNWGQPVDITASGLDLYRPTVAIDGRGRVWVFWSQNENGNFDLYARPIENGKPGQVERLTREAGSDVAPAAATDAKGRVWVAWQGWRNGKASIYAARREGNGFS